MSRENIIGELSETKLPTYAECPYAIGQWIKENGVKNVSELAGTAHD